MCVISLAWQKVTVIGHLLMVESSIDGEPNLPTIILDSSLKNIALEFFFLLILVCWNVGRKSASVSLSFCFFFFFYSLFLSCLAAFWKVYNQLYIKKEKQKW